MRAIELGLNAGGDAGRVVEDHDRRVVHVRQERLEVLVVRGQEPLRAEERASGHDVLDERARARRRHVDHVGKLADAVAREQHRITRQDRLPRRRKPRFGQRDILIVALQGPLLVGIERLDGEDEVSVELDADRKSGGRGPHVE
jgi:hypothetical protein